MANLNSEDKETDPDADKTSVRMKTIDFTKPQTPVPVQRSVVPVVAAGAGLLTIGGVGYYLYKKGQEEPQNTGVVPPQIPAPGEPPAQPPPQGQPQPPPQGQPQPPPQGQPQPPPQPPPQQQPPVPAGFWGTTNLGAEYRALFTKIEQVTGMPLRLYLCVVANREGSWQRTARNKTAKEVKASKDGIEGGLSRGNTKPQFSDSIAQAGSGGLFGALAPYVAWTGSDEGFMPYINADWTVIEDPIVAVICAAKYYQRIVTFYPTVFAGPKATSEDNFRVRLGWANPSVLKSDPNGKLAGEVRGRMEEDLAELGLKIGDLPPPSSIGWPGLKAVFDAMKGFPVTWK